MSADQLPTDVLINLGGLGLLVYVVSMGFKGIHERLDTLLREIGRLQS